MDLPLTITIHSAAKCAVSIMVSVVTLSTAKGLARWTERCFAALSMTEPMLVGNVHQGEEMLSDQPLSNGIGDGGGSARHIELDEDIAEVAIDGSGADDQRFGYFAVGLTLGHQAQHI